MPTVLQLRRGTTAEHSSFTGAEGEVTVNTTKDTLVVHDGSTAGGFELALADLSNTTATTYADFSVTDSGGDGSLTYDNSTGTFTYTGPSAAEVRAHITAGTGVSISSGQVAIGQAVGTGDSVTFAGVTAPLTGNVTGNVTGDVTGDLTGDVTGNVTGNVTGDLTGNVTGNADTASALQTARAIALSGDVSGTANFDGSAGITITATVADDSHNHVISNVDGLQTALDAKAPLASPTLTGTPTAPTAAAGANTTQIATTAFVATAVANVIDSAPGALDTLNELAAALGDDANFSTTVTNSIATKLNASAVSAFGLTLVDDADAATARTTLGLGTAATTASTDYATAAQGALADSAVQNLGDLGITSTAAELNILDGVTATTAELNYVDGVTSNIQTQLNAKLASSSYTASDVLTKIKTVDGTGSGLDADTVDGLEASAFATAAQGALADSAVQNLAGLSITATAAELNTLDGFTGVVADLNYAKDLRATGVTSTEFDYLDGVTSNIQTQLNAKLASSSYTAADVLTKIKTVDGASSGLDADLLDGQEGTYYRINIYNSSGTLLN